MKHIGEEMADIVYDTKCPVLSAITSIIYTMYSDQDKDLREIT